MKFIHLVPSAFVFLQMGALALGMASWLGGEDDEEEAASGGDDFDMDDDFDDFDEEFGGLDGMDDGGGGGGQDAGQNVTELQNRIDQLETEMANVSSKANTVRSENEQISESVDDVEENVRKLLEIYEMVTRGVNPFVDDVQAGGGMAEGGGNSFGLFDDDGENPDDEEELDDELASAEAEDFFADDALDEFDDDVDDGLDDFEMDAFDEDEGDEEGEGGGTSFEDLKAEYESGEAEWADEDLDEDGMDADEKDDLGFEDDEDLEEDDAGDLFLDDDIEDEELDGDEEAIDTGEDDIEADDAFEDLDETDELEGADDGLGTEPGSDPTPAPSASGLLSAGGNETPHLQEPPTGYLADVVVFEWLTGLLDEFGPRNTVRTLNYYERIGWISDDAREHLFTVLEGLSDSDHVYRQEMGTTELTMDDHLQSLEYIEELADGDLERGIIERCENLHVDGIQR